MIYRFEVTSVTGLAGVWRRELSDDFAAVAHLGEQVVSPDDSLKAFRSEDVTPFARREFAGDVEVFG